MLNAIWLMLMLSAVLIGIIHHSLPAVVASVTTSAKTAAMIALGLIGIMKDACDVTKYFR